MDTNRVTGLAQGMNINLASSSNTDFYMARSHCLIIDLSVCTNDATIRKSFSVTMSSRMFSNFSSIWVSVYG